MSTVNTLLFIAHPSTHHMMPLLSLATKEREIMQRLMRSSCILISLDSLYIGELSLQVLSSFQIFACQCHYESAIGCITIFVYTNAGASGGEFIEQVHGQNSSKGHIISMPVLDSHLKRLDKVKQRPPCKNGYKRLVLLRIWMIGVWLSN